MSHVQARMQRFLDKLVQEGRERGIQLAAYVDGALVVDAWAGICDVTTRRPVDGQTLFPVFSSTKGVAATVIHLLVERGKLSYETRIADLWPAFGAHGKGGITVRHALNHTAGLRCMPMGLGYRQLMDWDAMCAAMADSRPTTPPGAQMEYHAVTFGWLVGEVARRADGRAFSRIMEEEICRPLGIDSMFVGIPDDVEDRVATLDEVFEPGKEPVVDDTVPQAAPGWMQPLHALMNRHDARRACIPASNGIMTARALARHYAALIPGGVDGVELLPLARMRQATEVQRAGLGETSPTRGLGYCLGAPNATMGSRVTAFGHEGYGGSIGFADPEHRLAVALTKNLYSTGGAQVLVVRELREALGIPQ